MVATEDLQIVNDAVQAFGGGGDTALGGPARTAAADGADGADLLSGLARPFDGSAVPLDAEAVLDWNQRTLDAI
jgi:hypothetical protein